MLSFTRFNAIKPTRLSKRFTLANDATLKKEGGGDLLEGTAEKLVVADLAEFAALLPTLTPRQALSYGINGHDRARVVTAAAVAGAAAQSSEFVIARTRDHFTWPAGPGLMMLDYDAPQDGPALSPDELRAALAAACPALADAPAVWRPSASSCIHDAKTGAELRGIAGQRLYVAVADATDISRALVVLFDRLWLAGFGRYELSKSGAWLARSAIDASVAQPERLDFCGGADCGKGLQQRLPDPILVNPGAPYLDTRAALPDLDAAERQRLAELRESLKQPLRAEQQRIRAEWITTRVDARLSALPETDRAEAKPKLEKVYRKAADGGRLEPDFELIVVKKGSQARKQVTVGELLKDRAYHEATTCDPLEPDYPSGQSRLVGWLNLRAKEPYLQSQAHGGTRYVLVPRAGGTFSKASQASHPSLSITYTVTPGTKTITSITLPRALLVEDEDGKEHLVESIAAQAVADALRGLFGFCRESGHWYAFVGSHWQILSAPTTVEEVVAQLLYATVKAGFKARTLSAISSLLAKGLLPLPESALTSGRAIPFVNGLLDPTTRTLTPITPKSALTWCLPYPYDPAADCPTIKRFLLRAVTPDQMEPGDQPEDLVEFLRAWFAALLTGRADLQRYLHLLGPGGTSKGALIRLAGALVGAQNATVTDLRNLEQNRFETAKLYGKRLVAITDSGRYGGSIDVFKALTGQDPLRFEEKYRQQGATFTFDGLTLLASNEPLQFSDFTGAVERRRITIEFNRRVTDTERAAWDQQGGETAVLHREIPGLINWALELSREDITNRIQRQPQQIRRANRAALELTNPIAGWLLECTAPDPLHKLPMGRAEEVQVTDGSGTGRSETERRYRHADRWAYANYCTWCAQHRRLPVTSHRFKGLIIDLAQTLGAQVHGDKDREGSYIEGLRLRGPDESPDADPWRDGFVMDCDAFEGKHHTQPVDCDGCDGYDASRPQNNSHSDGKKNRDRGEV